MIADKEIADKRLPQSQISLTYFVSASLLAYPPSQIRMKFFPEPQKTIRLNYLTYN